MSKRQLSEALKASWPHISPSVITTFYFQHLWHCNFIKPPNPKTNQSVMNALWRLPTQACIHLYRCSRKHKPSNVSFRSLSRNRIYIQASLPLYTQTPSLQIPSTPTTTPADYSLLICPSSLSLLFSQQSHHNLHHVSEGESSSRCHHETLDPHYHFTLLLQSSDSVKLHQCRKRGQKEKWVNLKTFS